METQTGLYFKKISDKLQKRANEEGLKKRKIPYSQGRVLCYLHRREGEKVTLRDIERFFECSHATVSGLVSRLEKKGYVTVERDESDKRAKVVKPTESESASFRAVQARHKAVEEVLLKDFSDEEKELFTAFLKRVYENLG